MKYLLAIILSVSLAGCSVFSSSKAETAPYNVIETSADSKIELRQYESLILVSTPMNAEGRNSAFRELFDYISGENVNQSKIAMTTPVIMDDDSVTEEGTPIPMTTPVFMDAKGNAGMMSFVMPKDFTLDTTPLPKSKNVKVTELKDYTVAAIIFNGRLKADNIQKHKDILMNWMKVQKLKAIGDYKTAAYNAPFTLPVFRRNEVIIPVEKP